MKKALVILLCCAILFSGLILMSATTRHIVPENERGEPAGSVESTAKIEENEPYDLAGSERAVPANKNNQPQLVTDYESTRVQLENILASNYTWEEFRCQYSTCRKIDEYVNGKYSDFRVVCEEFPETFFCFSLVVGENGFSKMQLTAISARLEILLPAYVGRSFDDIIAIEGDRAGFTYTDALYQERYGYQYDTLHIYRDDFFYETTSHLQQGNVLQEDRIVMRRYDDSNLCPWDRDMDLTVDPNAPLAENIGKIVATRCSLETFQKNYPNTTILEETEASVTVTTAEFSQVKFVFEKAIDAWIGFERTVLEKAVIDARVLFPDYVGMKQGELAVECGFEFENRNIRDEYYLFLYEETVLYIVDFGMPSGGWIDELQSDTGIYIYPYSEQWVRPW